MKHLIKIYRFFLFALFFIFYTAKLNAQQQLFNGVYKGTSNGIIYTLRLENSNGSIKGTIRDIEAAGNNGKVHAKILDLRNIQGVQKYKGKRTRFIATEEYNVLLLEKRGLFLRMKLPEKERTIKFFKVNDDDTSQIGTLKKVNESN